MNHTALPSHSRLTRALAAARVIVWEYDLQTRQVTQAVPQHMFGPSQAGDPSVPLRRIMRLVHAQDRREVLRRARCAVEHRTPYVQHFRICPGGGAAPIWVEHHGSVVCDAAGRVIRLEGAMIDITAHKQALDVLAVADRRKDEFLATLAHELRNPLTAIGAAAQLLQTVALDTTQVHNFVDMIRRQAGQLCRLVDDLLDLSHVIRDRLELKLERTDLREAITTAVEATSELLKAHRHRLQLQLPAQPIDLYADHVRLSQLFGNLLTNAVKYTSEEGHIELTAERNGQWAIVRVRDCGMGIAAEDLPHLFEPFYQAESSLVHAHGGLGIGLALVRRIAQLHGGSVSAHSAGPGQGSEFVVRLPLVADERAVPRRDPAAIPTPGRAEHPLRILVADDNADVAEALSLSLRMCGHEVRVALDGEEALRLAEQFRPHAALLDLAMPKRAGHEVAREIRSRPWAAQNRILLVALTGWNARDQQGRFDLSAFDSQLLKPPDIDAIRRLLETTG
ncbi:MAG TPA: ATP-binding protein, partial [Steroidobacteraceae bacterium]|nr:ATP-binding protein [Steroidobacteraceae bacterium]